MAQKKKGTVLTGALVLAVIVGVLIFLLPARCAEGRAETESPISEGISFDSEKGLRELPEHADNGGKDTVGPSPSLSASQESDAGTVAGTVEQAAERRPGENRIEDEADPGSEILNETNGKKPEAVMLPAAKEPDKNVDAGIPPIPSESEKTAAIPPLAESPQSDVVKNDAPPKEAAKTDSTLVTVTSPGNLQARGGISKEPGAIDLTSAKQGAKNGLAPHLAADRGASSKIGLSLSKDSTNKNTELVVVTHAENIKQQISQSTETEKNGMLIPEKESANTDQSAVTADGGDAVTRDSGESAEQKLDALVDSGRKALGKSGALSIGLLLEGNRSTNQGWGLGAGLIAGYEITESFTVGIRGLYGNDLRNIESFEGLLYGRYYLPFKKEEFGLFAQLGIGGITFTESRTDAVSSVMMDISLGVRLFLGNFYLEPYLRAGYMVQLGAGLAFGYRLEE